MLATISLLLDQAGLGRYDAVANTLECIALGSVALVIFRASRRPTVTIPTLAVADVTAEAEAVVAAAADRQPADV